MEHHSQRLSPPPPQIERSPLYRSLPESVQERQNHERSHSMHSAKDTYAAFLSQSRVRIGRRPQSALDTLLKGNRSRSPGRSHANATFVATGTSTSFVESLRSYTSDVRLSHRVDDVSGAIGHSSTTADDKTGGDSSSWTGHGTSNRLVYCGTRFMVDQAKEVSSYEAAMEQQQNEAAFARERKWALLRMRQVEKDTRIQREAIHKKKLREARLIARQQQEEVFNREKEFANHNERKVRSAMETQERKERRQVAYAMWSSAATIMFTKAFDELFSDETRDRYEIEESYLNDTESKARAFVLRITTSDRTSLLQQEKSERIVCLRYVMAYGAWKASQDQQVSNLVNAERKQRYRVYDAEGLAFGEIDAIKQGILAEIAREARKKQEARLAAIREMELYHQHQRRVNDEEESSGRNILRNEEQTVRAQLRLAMLDDRKLSHDRTHARQQMEHQRWRNQCWLEQQPLIESETQHRHNTILDESTEFRVLQLLRQQLWEEILSPMCMMLTEEGVSSAAVGKKQRIALSTVLSTSEQVLDAISPTNMSAADASVSSSATKTGAPKLSKTLRSTSSGTTKLQYDLCLPYGTLGVPLCPGVSLRRKLDVKHYTQQPLSQVFVIVRLRGGGRPGDEAFVLSSALHSIKEKSGVQSLILPPVAGATGKQPAKGGANLTLEAPSSSDPRTLAQQLLYPSLKLVDSVIYDEENQPLCTVEATDAIPTLEELSSCDDWYHAQQRLEDDQAEEDGVILLALSVPPVDKDNIKGLERILQSLIFCPGQLEASSLSQRRIEIEIVYQAPQRRKMSLSPMSPSLRQYSTFRGSTKFLSSASSLQNAGAAAGSPNSLSSTSLSTAGTLTSAYRMLIAVRMIQTAPFVALGAPSSLMTQIGLRASVFHDTRVPHNAKSVKQPSSTLFPVVLSWPSIDTNWWAAKGAAGQREAIFPPLATDFQGCLIRIRFAEGAASEDSIQLAVNEEFSMKRDEIKFSPSSATAQLGLDPMTCARVVYGKLMPGSPNSSKEFWLLFAEAPSYWSTSASCPAYIPATLVERVLERLVFTTLSPSTLRRVIEATVVLPRRLGSASVTLRADVSVSGSSGTVCALWTGLEDPSSLYLRYVESRLSTLEQHRSVLYSDAIHLFPSLNLESSGLKQSTQNVEALPTGCGTIRVSVADQPFLWDTIALQPRSPVNTHGLLTLAAVPGSNHAAATPSSMIKVMWSMHQNDETSLQHVATVRRFTSLEGKQRPGVAIDLNENCRCGALSAILSSLTFATIVPSACEGLIKTVLLEVALNASDASKGKPTPVSQGSPDSKAKVAASPVKGSASNDIVSMTTLQQLFSSIMVPARVSVQVHCGSPLIRVQQNTASPGIVLPRLEPLVQQAEALHIAPVSMFLAGGTAPTIAVKPNDPFDCGTIEITCFKTGTTIRSTNAPVDVSGTDTVTIPKVKWQIGLCIPTASSCENPTQPTESGALVRKDSVRALRTEDAPLVDISEKYRWQSVSHDDASLVRGRSICKRGDASGDELVRSVATCATPTIVSRILAVQSHASGVVGFAAICASALQLQLGGRKRAEYIRTSLTPQVSLAEVMDVLSSIVLSPALNLTLAPQTETPQDGALPGTSGPLQNSTTVETNDESLILRVALTDAFGFKHQVAFPVEISPRNLPSYFTHLPTAPLVWRYASGHHGSMPLMPNSVIQDEDTERTGEAAYLRVESVSGVGADDKLVFLSGAQIPASLQLLPKPLRVVEFVEPLRDGEIRRYHVRYEDKRGDETEVGTGMLTYGTVNPTFSFTFAKDVSLPICSQVLRQIAFRHDEKYPYRLHTRQLLVRFNAMDGDGVVDTRHLLSVQVAPPLLYVLPLYETSRLKHSQTKEVMLFPKVILGVPPSSTIGQSLHVRLESRVTDEEIALMFESDPRDGIFFEKDGKYISFSCSLAASLLSSTSARRISSTLGAAVADMEDLPVAPTPGFEGLLFAKVKVQTPKEVQLELATSAMTRGNDTLIAAAIPLFLSKVAFRTTAVEPIATNRCATVVWTKSEEEVVALPVRILVESGELVGTMSSCVDSMRVFIKHPTIVLPDACINDVSADMVLGKEAELTATIVDAAVGDTLLIQPSEAAVGMDVSEDTSLDGALASRVHYVKESRSFVLDGDEVGWMEQSSTVPHGGLNKLTIRFSQCPVEGAQDILRRIAFLCEEASTVGQRKLLEISLKVYQSQAMASMLHVQLAVTQFPFALPKTFGSRVVEYRQGNPPSPLCRSMQWWSSEALAFGSSHSGVGHTQGLAVNFQLIFAASRAFQCLEVDDAQVTPSSVPACLHYDRIRMLTLPPHLIASSSGAASSSSVITLAGKGTLVCQVEQSPDFRSLSLNFSSGKPLPYQLVLDVLGCVGYEFVDIGESAGDQDPKKSKMQRSGSIALSPPPSNTLPASLQNMAKGERRYLAIRMETSLPVVSRGTVGTDGVVTGDDVIPVACIM